MSMRRALSVNALYLVVCGLLLGLVSFGSASASAVGEIISIRALANGKFVTAESAGFDPLIANRDRVGPWEQFEIVSQGSGLVALRSRANGLFVCADGAGTLPLVANREIAGPWETFELIANLDGSSSLRSLSNGMLVTAESAGALSLRANRNQVGPWEKFDFEDIDSSSNGTSAPGGPPDPNQVGVPAGTNLTPYRGDITVDRDGTVIAGLDIYGSIKVHANNVTIRNSLVRGGPDQPQNQALIASWWGGRDLKVEDSTLRPDYPTYMLDGISGASITVRRVEISGVVDGAKVIGGDFKIENSWIHDLAYFDPDPNQPDGKTHNDNVQIIYGSDIVISGNLLEGSRNSAIMLSQGKAATGNVLVTNNWLKDGACTINVSQGSFGRPILGLQIRGNVFGTGRYGWTCPARLPKSSPILFGNNIWWDSGQRAWPNYF